MADMDAEARFQLAAKAALRIVSQCRAHVGRVGERLESYTAAPAQSTPLRRDLAAAVRGDHRLAFQQRITHIEAMSNALRSHLAGLQRLLEDDVFHGLPATAITRSIAEVSASCAWILDANASEDARSARGYASVFHSLELAIAAAQPDDRSRLAGAREKMVAYLDGSGVIVTRKVRHRKPLGAVARVTVGHASADTEYKLTTMVREQIPRLGDMYRSLSAVTHGDTTHVIGAWEAPDQFERRIAVVTWRSVEQWSESVHAWVGVEAGTFVNPADIENLRQSIGPARLAELEERSPMA